MKITIVLNDIVVVVVVVVTVINIIIVGVTADNVDNNIAVVACISRQLRRDFVLEELE